MPCSAGGSREVGRWEDGGGGGGRGGAVSAIIGEVRSDQSWAQGEYTLSASEAGHINNEKASVSSAAHPRAKLMLKLYSCWVTKPGGEERRPRPRWPTPVSAPYWGKSQ